MLSPTRELAAQIGESFQTYGRHIRYRQAVIFGGVSQHAQVRALKRGVHVAIATPGRLLDLMQQGHLNLSGLETFVLDEADRMLDMGFLPDLKRIIAKLPGDRQSLFFSATMPPNVAKLAAGLLHDPVRVEVAPQSSTVERISQRVLFVKKSDKRQLLLRLLSAGDVRRALIFTRTKHGADNVVKYLNRDGQRANAIHGNKSQNARTRTLGEFRNGRVRLLVATDIAARGIDVDGISHVINYDMPHEPESYVHRIGRTGRAGAEGIAVSFCDADERSSLRAIEKLIQEPIDVDSNHPFHAPSSASPAKSPARRPPKARRNRRPRGGKITPSRRKTIGAKSAKRVVA